MDCGVNIRSDAEWERGPYVLFLLLAEHTPLSAANPSSVSVSPPPGLLSTVNPPRRSLLSAYEYTKPWCAAAVPPCTGTYNDMNAVWVSAWAAGAGSDLASAKPRCNGDLGATCSNFDMADQLS